MFIVSEEVLSEANGIKKLLLIVLVLFLLPAVAIFAGGRLKKKGTEKEAEPAKEKAAAQEEMPKLRVTFAWPTYIDPAVGSDFSSSSAFVNLYDTLVYPTPDGGVKPNVAKRWETSEDGLTWTFYLRKGVKFHDGTELTARDVAFTMDRLVEIGGGYGYMFSGKVKSSEALDDYTVQFKLTEPYGEKGDYGKEWLLTNDAGSDPYMVEPEPNHWARCHLYPGAAGE